jgi:hypothetical protein
MVPLAEAVAVLAAPPELLELLELLEPEALAVLLAGQAGVALAAGFSLETQVWPFQLHHRQDLFSW